VRTKFKTILLTAAVKLLNLLKLAFKGLFQLLKLLAKPFIAVVVFVIKPLVLKLYKYYLLLKNKLNKSPLLKSKVGLIFYNRYLIHVILIIIALTVASTNILQANEVKREDVAKKSNLYKLVSPEELNFSEEEIVEKANFKEKKQKNYIDTSGIAVTNIPELAKKENTQEIALLGDATAITATNVLEGGYSKKRAETIGYDVQAGDTISSIAAQFGLKVSTLYWANKMSSNTTLKPGYTMTIPTGDGTLHKVVEGDTLDKIVEKYKGDKEETILLNDIGNDELVAVGTEILVAGGTPPPPPPPVAKTPSSSIGSSSWGAFWQPSSGYNVTGGALNWPSACRSISQNPRWGHIAIDVNCAHGTGIYAAESGTATVIPNKGNGYGNYIIINHGNGMTTLYAHLSGFAVSSGQYVSRGQQIGYEGSTGWSTGPHLHFEVMVNGAKQNPWSYL
jgi:murein DD-endopeptidase MepM/ murein hydrolase activator NlpD